ncbi:MAG TPA: hypothetical protein VN734_15230, partial [Acidobacteriaceae bacterium]|nr:hypothetical protein [Acidobacteriaceae bacterium]
AKLSTRGLSLLEGRYVEACRMADLADPRHGIPLLLVYVPLTHATSTQPNSAPGTQTSMF